VKRLKLIVSLWAALALFGGATAQTNVELWHGLGEPLGGMLESIVAAFNASQDDYVVTPAYRGTYTETLVAAIAASRAGNAPHIVQMFEVGTATMMAAGDAIVPVHQLMEDTSVEFDPDIYIPAIRGYYSLPDGSMMSMPFNSSTAVMWYNKDAFREAGLDPEDPPETCARPPGKLSTAAPRPAVSPPPGRPGPRSSSSAPSTTCPSAPAPTAWKGSTPS
jgi:sn-glycerol 3-phosphate transport system substrate-binding protein